MARYDVEKLARDIVNIEKKHSALSLTTQLPNSSVRLSTGEEGDVAAGIEDGTDALANSETLYDYADEIGDLNDEDIDYGATIPDWILNAGSVGDTAWELADINNEAVTEALENADQAVSDALAAAQKAAEADKKATEAKGAAKEYLPNTNFSLGADGLDGWTVLDGTPATYEGGGLLVGISFDEDDQAVWHDYVEDVSIRGTGEYSVSPGSSIELSTDFTVFSGGDSYLTMYIDVAVAGSHYVRTKEITISETNISATRSMTWTNDDDEAAYVRVGYVIHVEPGAQYVSVSQATLKDVTEVIKAQKEAESARFLAEGIFNVIPSVDEPTQAPNGSALKQGDQWWVIGEQGSEQAGKFVGVKVFDGTQWIDRQIVADSVLVPGSVGPVLIEDGAISGQTINGSDIYGANIIGGYIEGAEIRLQGLSNEELVASLPKDLEDDFNNEIYNVEPFYPGRGENEWCYKSTATASYDGYAYVDFLAAELWTYRNALTTFSVWVKSPESAKVTLGPSFVGNSYTTKTLVADTWTNLIVTYPPGESASYGMTLSFNPEETPYILIDDVETRQFGGNASSVGIERYGGVPRFSGTDPDGFRNLELTGNRLRLGSDYVTGLIGRNYPAVQLANSNEDDLYGYKHETNYGVSELDFRRTQKGDVSVVKGFSIGYAYNNLNQARMRTRDVFTFEAEGGTNGKYVFDAKTTFPGNTLNTLAEMVQWDDAPKGTRGWLVTQNAEVFVDSSGNWRFNYYDTEWFYPNYKTSFQAYGNDPLKVRRINDTVVLAGVSTCTVANHLSSNTARVIATLPSKYTPSTRMSWRCQGSGNNTWLLQVDTNGDVLASRYDGNHNNNVWLPHTATWMVL